MQAKVVISRNGIWVGEGYWQNNRIVDCPAVLPEEVYVAIEESILASFGMVEMMPFETVKAEEDYQEGTVIIEGYCYDWWYLPDEGR